MSSPLETCDFARNLGGKLSRGHVLLLHGGIGSGKTHFSRCLIQSILNQPEDIPSPTFTLVQTYDTKKGDVWHADLYRLSHPDEVIELGLFDAFSDAICLVEWPDRLVDITPENALNLHFETTAIDETRNISLTWSNLAWTAILKDLENEA